jgi:hypothetical protein
MVAGREEHEEEGSNSFHGSGAVEAFSVPVEWEAAHKTNEGE